MGFESVHNAIRTRFKTTVADVITPETVGWDNAPFDTPTDNGYVYFTILPGKSQLRDIGSATKGSRYPGLAVAQIFVLPNKGSKRALELADIIANAFRNINTAGVEYQEPDLIRIGLAKGFYQLNVQIPFRADQTN